MIYPCVLSITWTLNLTGFQNVDGVAKPLAGINPSDKEVSLLLVADL